jgi:hypothetical protein
VVLWTLLGKAQAYPLGASHKGSLTEGMVDLLVLTSLDQLLFKMKIFFHLFYLNEEVNCTETSPSVSVPCSFVLYKVIALLENIRLQWKWASLRY